jgi:hypothetical protein
MRVERCLVVLNLASPWNDDKVWLGWWLRRYDVFLHPPENRPLVVSQERLKQFCRTLPAKQPFLHDTNGLCFGSTS